MKELFSINDVAAMTGLTTRTLRNYIALGFLKGSKTDGVWAFTVEEFEDFISNPNVRPAIQTKNKSLVFDFLSETKKQTNQICAVLDLRVQSLEEKKEISDFFCTEVNNSDCANAAFKLEITEEHARISLSGNEDFVSTVLFKWYGLKG